MGPARDTDGPHLESHTFLGRLVGSNPLEGHVPVDLVPVDLVPVDCVPVDRVHIEPLHGRNWVSNDAQRLLAALAECLLTGS